MTSGLHTHEHTWVYSTLHKTASSHTHPNICYTHLHRCNSKLTALLNIIKFNFCVCVEVPLNSQNSADTSYFLSEYSAPKAVRNELWLCPFARRWSRNTEMNDLPGLRSSPTSISVGIVESCPKSGTPPLSPPQIALGQAAPYHPATCILTGFFFDFIHFRHQ